MSVPWEGALLVAMPAHLPVNIRLPALLNLRVISRAFGGKPQVLAAGGNSLPVLRSLLAADRFGAVVIEFSPDYLESLPAIDRIAESGTERQKVLVAGSALKYWTGHIRDRCRYVTPLAPGSSILALAGLDLATAHQHLAPPDSELAAQPVWEKRRLAVAIGCPPGCRLCPRHDDIGSAVQIRAPGDVMEEIHRKLAHFGVRDVEIVGAAWAGDPDWPTQFLEARIRSELDIRLRLLATIDQLSDDLAMLLVPGGCTHLILRAGPEAAEISPAVTAAMHLLAARGSVSLVCPSAPGDESAADASARIAALAQALDARFVHVLLHTEQDMPPSCCELVGLAGRGHLAIHFGITQRADPHSWAWAEAFGRSFYACLNSTGRKR
jgi:hypothetical protein